VALILFGGIIIIVIMYFNNLFIGQRFVNTLYTSTS